MLDYPEFHVCVLKAYPEPVVGLSVHCTSFRIFTSAVVRTKEEVEKWEDTPTQKVQKINLSLFYEGVSLYIRA